MTSEGREVAAVWVEERKKTPDTKSDLGNEHLAAC